MPKFFAGLFLIASIIFSFELVNSQFSSLFLVLSELVLLGLTYTCIFGGGGAYDINIFDL